MRLTTWFLTAVLVCSTGGAVAGEKYGILTGRYLLKGEIPPSKIVMKAGAAAGIPPFVLPHKPLPDNTLVVDSKTRGIANVVIYPRNKPKIIHPALRDSKKKRVVFEQKNMRFTPHILVARTDQTIVLKTGDPVGNNVQYFTFVNPVAAIAVPKNGQGVSVKLPQAEFIPVKVVSNVYPHMKAYWTVSDHPYVAVTDSAGKFKIEKFPAGRHTFWVWHERCGFIAKRLEVVIEGGKTTGLGTVEVPMEKLK